MRCGTKWGKRGAAALSSVLVWLTAGTASARDRTIDPVPLFDVKVRMDGMLREWPADFENLSTKIQGSGPRASGMLGYDDRNLYVALKVYDDQLVRTRGAGRGEDHATLYVAFPDAQGRYTTTTVTLFPGDPGKLPGVVKVAGRNVTGSKLVEAPMEGGLTFEAQIPWSALPQAAKVRVGLRGALRYTDASAPGRIRGVVGTSAAKAGSALPTLALESERALRGALLSPKGLGDKPEREAYGNVVGDARVERVAQYGTYLSIVGPGYREGKEFYYGELAIADASGLRSLELRDLNGDGRAEIILSARNGGSERYREVLQVIHVQSDGTPRVAFSHEVAIKTEDGLIDNEVKIKGNGKQATITVAQGKADGFDPGTYAEPLAGGMPSALLPWQTVKSRTFAWKGDTLEVVDEESWTPKQTASAGRSSGSKPAGPPPPPAPRPPSADELLDRVYALYRNDRGVGKSKPRFDFVTDVVEDTQNERVLVHGKDIVVFGKGFRNGTSYAYIQVGVAEPDDILHATARDLTGDGKAEILLRTVMRGKTSKELGSLDVVRHALLVYQLQGSQLVRIFAAETGRAVEKNRILGAVAFEPAARGVEIELRPARAVGWTERNYPFPPDTTTAGGLEPLLLPWASGAKRRYTFDGKAYSLQ